MHEQSLKPGLEVVKENGTEAKASGQPLCPYCGCAFVPMYSEYKNVIPGQGTVVLAVFSCSACKKVVSGQVAGVIPSPLANPANRRGLVF